MGLHLCRISICGKRQAQTPPNGLKERLIRENNTHLDLKLNKIQGRSITLIGVNGHVLPQCAPRNCRLSPFLWGRRYSKSKIDLSVRICMAPPYSFPCSTAASAIDVKSCVWQWQCKAFQSSTAKQAKQIPGFFYFKPQLAWIYFGTSDSFLLPPD